MFDVLYLFSVFITVYICIIRYCLNKKGVLTTGLIVSIFAIADVGISNGWTSTGVLFGLSAVLAIIAQLVSINLSFMFRLWLSVSITLVSIVIFSDYASIWLLSAFIIARIAESSNILGVLRFGLCVTHVIWLFYGISIDAYLVILTQSIQIMMIVLITFYKDRTISLSKKIIPRSAANFQLT